MRRKSDALFLLQQKRLGWMTKLVGNNRLRTYQPREKAAFTPRPRDDAMNHNGYDSCVLPSGTTDSKQGGRGNTPPADHRGEKSQNVQHMGMTDAFLRLLVNCPRSFWINTPNSRHIDAAVISYGESRQWVTGQHTSSLQYQSIGWTTGLSAIALV